MAVVRLMLKSKMDLYVGIFLAASANIIKD